MRTVGMIKKMIIGQFYFAQSPKEMKPQSCSLFILAFFA